MNIRNHFPTEELQKRDAAHHLHPFTAQHDLANKGSRIITSAQGVYVYDSNGEELLDAMAGLWCVNAGHNRKKINEAITKQLSVAKRIGGTTKAFELEINGRSLHLSSPPEII